jgi:RNA polymerase sigma factor (sigma-70 family)
MATSQMRKVVNHLRKIVIAQNPVEESDGQLLERFIEHLDQAAFADILARHGAMVLGVCRRVLRNPHDAEDAFQATFLVLVRKAAAITSRQLLANWLYGVAYKTALKAKAAAAKQSLREKQVTDMPEPETVERHHDVWADLQPLLDQELSGLPDKYRIPIVLCELEGKGIKEAARHLGWPQGTLAGRLARARTMLAERLSRRGVAVSSGLLVALLSQNTASAVVPTSVASSTLQAACLLAAGQAAVPGALSAKVAALTDGVLNAMLLTKLKIAASWVLVAALGITMGLIAHSAPVQRQGAGDAEERTTERTVANSADPKAQVEELKARATISDAGAMLPLCFHPDGKTLASLSRDGGAVKLWDLARGKERATLKTNAQCYASQAVFSPDGKILACVTARSNGARFTGEVELWDVASGKQQANLTGHADMVRCVAFSPDSTILASASQVDNVVKLWNVADGKERATLPDLYSGPNRLLDLAFSPDGKTLALAGGRFDPATKRAWDEVKLWDLASGKVRATFQGQNGGVIRVAFSSDGKSLAGVGNRWQPPAQGADHGLHVPLAVTLWEVATGSERASFQELTAPMNLYCLAFSPDCRTLAWSAGPEQKTAKLWNLASGKEQATLQGHADVVGSLAFSPDGKTLASGSSDKTIKLWDIPASKEVAPGTVSTKELEGMWTTLPGADAAKAYRAINTLVARPKQAIALLKERLRPAAEPDAQQINRWIADLDSDQFTVRQKARETLAAIGDLAHPALRKTLADKPPLEVSRQIEQLLNSMSPESVAALRAVEVLERIGSSEAKQVLETLAKGAEASRLTAEAKASLNRLKRLASTD